MTDHQQAAIEAGAYRLLWKFEDLPHGTRGQVAPYVTETHREWAEDIIAAAEPHLRKKWAEEVLKEGILGAGYSVLMNPNRGEHPVTTFTRAVKHMLDLLEGVGE